MKLQRRCSTAGKGNNLRASPSGMPKHHLHKFEILNPVLKNYEALSSYKSTKTTEINGSNNVLYFV